MKREELQTKIEDVIFDSEVTSEIMLDIDSFVKNQLIQYEMHRQELLDGKGRSNRQKAEKTINLYFVN